MAAQDRKTLDTGSSLELFAKRLGQIGHLVEIGFAPLVDPAEELGGTEALLTQLVAERSQPLEVEIKQIGCHCMRGSRKINERRCSGWGRRKRFRRQRFQRRRNRARRWHRCCQRSQHGWCRRRPSSGRWRPSV